MARHNYDKKLERLITILHRLYDGETLSTEMLAQEFGVSQRTIQRDFNERLSRFPIVRTNGQWKMKEGFKLEKIASVEETLVLEMLEKTIESMGSRFSHYAVPILHRLKNPCFNPFYLKTDIEDIGEKIRELSLLQQAIHQRKCIRCYYEKEEFYRNEKELEPLKVVNYEGFWYLVAIDAKDDIVKRYYLKNIFQVSLLNTHYTYDKALDTLIENSVSVWFNADEEPYEVKLHVSKEIAKYFKRKPLSKTQKILSESPDGDLILSVEITADMEILPVVKYWLPHIRVLTPKRIQTAIKKELKAFLEES